MPTTKLPDNGHTASQKIANQQLMPLEGQGAEVTSPEPSHVDTTNGGIHRQIHDALETPTFKRDAAGKSGEALKIVVAAALAAEKVLVEIVSVGLADTAEAYVNPVRGRLADRSGLCSGTKLFRRVS